MVIGIYGHANRRDENNEFKVTTFLELPESAPNNFSHIDSRLKISVRDPYHKSDLSAEASAH